MFRHDVARKRKGPRPPNSGLFFSGAVAMAVCVGSVVRSFLPEWQATVAGAVGAAVVGLVARLWHRWADLRYRVARSLAE